jgi:deoxyadenosine/deoxycytidine kinase
MRVCVVGNVGAGKSAALDALAAAGYAVVPEPVDAWGDLLDKMYADPKKYGLAFSLRVLLDMSAVADPAGPDDDAAPGPDAKAGVVVVERSPLCNRHVFTQLLHNDGSMSTTEWDTYKDCHDLLAWRPDAIVYLDTPTDVCARRIEARGRPCEAGIDVQWLRRVEFQYETMLKFANVPVSRVAGTGSAADVGAACVAAVAALADATRTLTALRPSAGA